MSTTIRVIHCGVGGRAGWPIGLIAAMKDDPSPDFVTVGLVDTDKPATEVRLTCRSLLPYFRSHFAPFWGAIFAQIFARRCLPSTHIRQPLLLVVASSIWFLRDCSSVMITLQVRPSGQASAQAISACAIFEVCFFFLTGCLREQEQMDTAMETTGLPASVCFLNKYDPEQGLVLICNIFYPDFPCVSVCFCVLI